MLDHIIHTILQLTIWVQHFLPALTKLLYTSSSSGRWKEILPELFSMGQKWGCGDSSRGPTKDRRGVTWWINLSFPQPSPPESESPIASRWNGFTQPPLVINYTRESPNVPGVGKLPLPSLPLHSPSQFSFASLRLDENPCLGRS